ncbi:MAG TPA: outer membrane protein transport protein [Xanthobacteraceae bacterium]|nr:outer membrane protein transport protein [Xanthobacteraceae bacterium]
MAGRVGSRSALAAGTVLAGVLLPLSMAEAGGFAVREQSAYFQGSAFAGQAAGGPSISSMFWNPAAMTDAAYGLTTESNLSGVFGQTKINPSAAANGPAYPSGYLLGLGGGRDIFEDAFVPASYTVWRPTPQLALGFSFNSPFGLVTDPSRDTAFMFYSRYSDVLTVNLTPQVAYKFTDWLSVGVGVQIQYFRTQLESAMPGSAFPPTSPATLSIRGDSVDFGFTAGILLTPTPRTSIGVGFRSGFDHKLDGDVRRPGFTTLVGGVPVAIPPAVVSIAPTVKLPESVNIGLRQKVTDAFTVLATAEWTNWSRLGRVAVNAFPPGVPAVPAVLPFEWKDGWFVSGGVEYQWSQELALRAGVGYEWSPVTDATRGTRLPDNNRVWLGAGLTYNWNEKIALEFGYSHVFVRDADIAIGPGHALFDSSGGALGTFAGTASSHIDVISVGFRYRWGQWPPFVKG